ncbi:uncharacterized protein LOC122242871 [Penaeus japonicus]|uniref:uncharacterized protein LOC122242871 n=1 Tax=Penaeus japonicus TaxID=27405 RepID=UPI001C70FB10|nr:uncharacterized protein LOC122242871 [Penaeus japonicus]
MSALVLAPDLANITQEYIGNGTGLPLPDEALLDLNMSRKVEGRDIPSLFHNKNSLLWSLLMSATMAALDPGAEDENVTLPFTTTSIPGDPPGETVAANVVPVGNGVSLNTGATSSVSPWKTTADLDPGGTTRDVARTTTTEMSKPKDMSLTVTSQLLQLSLEDKNASQNPVVATLDHGTATGSATEDTFKGNEFDSQPPALSEGQDSKSDAGSPSRNQSVSGGAFSDALQQSMIDAQLSEPSNTNQADIENKKPLHLSNDSIISVMPPPDLTQLMASSVNTTPTSAQSDPATVPETSVPKTLTKMVEVAEENSGSSVPLRIVNDPSTPDSHRHDAGFITQGSSIPESRTSQNANTGSDWSPDDTAQPDKVVSQAQGIGRPDSNGPPVWGTSAGTEQVRTVLPHSLDIVVETHTHQTASKPSILSKNPAFSQVHQPFQAFVPGTHKLEVLEEQQGFQTFKPVSQNISLKSQQTIGPSEILSDGDGDPPPEPEPGDDDIFQNGSDAILFETNSSYNNTTALEEPAALGGINWTASRITLFIIQLVIMVETVLGNLMVILSVKMEKKLQTPFNYYIVNLAFTDMNVGLSVMSLFMINNLYDYFPFGSFLCNYWIWSDYVMTFESVMTLAAISLDRLWSVTWSLHYRNNNSGKKSMWIIIATWLYVSVLWFPAFIYDRVLHHYDVGVCFWDTVLNKNLVVYVGMLGYYMPLLVMVGAYMKILHVVRKRAASIRDAGKKEVPTTSQPVESDSGTGEAGGSTGAGGSSDQKKLVAAPVKDDKQEAKLKREMKAVYTLLNIVIIFLICWVPFYILFVLSAWFPTLFPEWYLTFSYWMAYINSALNPILYPLSSLEFRAAYKKVFYTIFCGK